MKHFFLLISFFVCIGVFAQKDYVFDHFSHYKNGALSESKPLEDTYIYDNSKDTSYQLFVYPEEAKLVDEAYNEIHYFKKETVNDSIRYRYDYSLKVFFQPDVKITGITVKKINDIDYEVSYMKEMDKKRSKHLLVICLQENEVDLLQTAYLDMSKKEAGIIFRQLKKWVNPDKNYYVHTVFNSNGRYRFAYERVEVKKEELRVTVPKEKYYKNSFLKK